MGRYDVKQQRDCEAGTRLMTLIALSLPKGSCHYSFVFVTQEVEKSNFYKDLETLLEWIDSNDISN